MILRMLCARLDFGFFYTQLAFLQVDNIFMDFERLLGLVVFVILVFVPTIRSWRIWDVSILSGTGQNRFYPLWGE